MKSIYLITVFAALVGLSCKKIVTLKLSNVPAAIVIQGNVTNQPGPYYVTISQPVDFYADNNFPPVSGASVLISNSEGQTDSLTEISPGNYATNFIQGAPGDTYRLSVTAQGVNYTASSTMPTTVNLDSITFEENKGFGRTRISAVVNFQDPAGVRNYYQFVEYLNGAPLTKDLFVLDDRLSDGRYINYTLYNDTSYLQVGDAVRVDLYCIDSTIYNYFFQLLQSDGAASFNTSASPANPGSNISNGAFGYFSAHTVSTQAEFIP